METVHKEHHMVTQSPSQTLNTWIHEGQQPIGKANLGLIFSLEDHQRELAVPMNVCFARASGDNRRIMTLVEDRTNFKAFLFWNMHFPEKPRLEIDRILYVPAIHRITKAAISNCGSLVVYCTEGGGLQFFRLHDREWIDDGYMGDVFCKSVDWSIESKETLVVTTTRDDTALYARVTEGILWWKRTVWKQVP